jgi:hypothetical protein
MVRFWSVRCEHGELIVSSPEDDRIAATVCSPRGGCKASLKVMRRMCANAQNADFRGDTIRALMDGAGRRRIDMNRDRLHGISKQEAARQLEDFMSRNRNWWDLSRR